MITNYSQAKNIVENKFLTSQYIQSRNISEERKYFPEEIHYWATKIINTNMSESELNSDFDSVYLSTQQSNLSSLKYNDYIGQTIFIDSNTNPDGLFLSSIGVFFSSKDSRTPISLELRPLVNGYPSSTEVVPLSKVTLYATNVIEATLPLTSSSATKFTFDFPVFLEPGYYAFVLSTNSSNYNVYIAERGAADLYTKKTTVNPYNGSFVVSQQGVSWNVEQTKDLCFTLNKAQFDIGTKTLEIISNPSIFDFTTVNLQTKTQEFGESAYISDSSVTVQDSSTLLDSTLPIKLNKNINIATRSSANTNGVIFSIDLTNTSKNISPLIDLHKTGINLVTNLIDSYSTEISNSELTLSGLAQCKYITKQIELNDNFDADGITVFIDVNKPAGTEVEVFYKIQNKYDYSNEFKDLGWTKMSKTSQSITSTNLQDFVEETYQNVNLSYYDSLGNYHNNFKYFAIKLVMYTNNPCTVPLIKNLRAIATV
jgi:hypothetical protein